MDWTTNVRERSQEGTVLLSAETEKAVGELAGRDINKPTFGCVEFEILIRSPSTNIKHAIGGSDGKEYSCNVGDPGLIPGSGRSPGEGNGDPLQYSCLENFMDTGAWWATVHEVTKGQT